MIDTGLKDKVVLVTGAQHGIGAATAKAFAAEGAMVFIHYLRLPSKTSNSSAVGKAAVGTPGETLYRSRQAMSADEVLQAIRSQGGRAEPWEADLSDPEAIPQLFNHAEEAFGPVDVLVNNAAHCDPDTFIPESQLRPGDRSPGGFLMGTIRAESCDRHFAVNTRGEELICH